MTVAVAGCLISSVVFLFCTEQAARQHC